MIELPSLYDHQTELRDRVRTSLVKNRRIILCANPGFGKTRCAKWILGAAANREVKPNQSGRALFCVHRRGLVDNAIDSFAEDPPVPHGTIMSGCETSYGSRVQVASIDTLVSWFLNEETGYPSDVTFDLMVWDEAHSHHPKFAKFLKYHDERREELGQPPAFVLGLTATPQARGLADVYEEIVSGASTEWLIDNGFLSPFRYYQGTQGQLGKLVKRGCEYTKDSEAEAMDGLAGDLVRDWKKYGEGRPTVGFFPNRAQAKSAMVMLKAAGVRVEYVDGNTPDIERKVIFESLNEHSIDYLCNVQVVERGTDIPRIGCVQLCVCIGSVVRFRQMIGRGSRVHPEKDDCLVLDHGGNVLRHGFFEDDYQWSLDQSEKEPSEITAAPTIECPGCQAIYRGGTCSQCGYEPTEKERKSVGLEFTGSELREVTKEGAKPKKIKDPESLMIESLYRAGRSGRTWKQAVGMFLRACEKQGQRHRVPRTITVAGRKYETIRYGDKAGTRRVSALYPFVNGEHGGDYLMVGEKASNAPTSDVTSPPKEDKNAEGQISFDAFS